MEFKLNNSKNMSRIFIFVLSIVLFGCNTTPVQQSFKKIADKANNNPVTSKNISQKDSTDEVITPNNTQKKETTVPSRNKRKSYNTVWSEMSDNFVLSEQYTSHYDEYISSYLNQRELLTQLSVRSRPYLYHILQEVKLRNMPYEIILLPAVESGFSPKAKSPARAAGLWQFMPRTAKQYNLKRNWWQDQRLDVIKSTEAALNYLKFLYKLNNNDWLLALASYNVGYGNILKAQKKFLKNSPYKDANFWNIRQYLPKETREYVPKLLALSHIVKYRKQYQVILKDVPNNPLVRTITLNKQVDLNKISKRTHVPLDTIKKLNPGYLRTSTPPTGENGLLFPVDKVHLFQEQLAQNESVFNVSTIRHIIKPGDSLIAIAAKYKSSVNEIKRINNMKGTTIRAGKILLIPTSKHYAFNSTRHKNYLSTRAKKIIYTIKPGQSLWTIAKKYGVETNEIARWNGIEQTQVIRVGRKLIIWL